MHFTSKDFEKLFYHWANWIAWDAKPSYLQVKWKCMDTQDLCLLLSYTKDVISLTNNSITVIHLDFKWTLMWDRGLVSPSKRSHNLSYLQSVISSHFSLYPKTENIERHACCKFLIVWILTRLGSDLFSHSFVFSWDFQWSTSSLLFIWSFVGRQSMPKPN